MVRVDEVHQAKKCLVSEKIQLLQSSAKKERQVEMWTMKRYIS